MFHDPETKLADLTSYSHPAKTRVAYIREMTAEEIMSKFENMPDLSCEMTYWAMFAEDGTPLMLAGSKGDLTDTAFYNEFTALMPN